MLDKRFIVVSGKGGVGKSAVAAAIAIAGARAGKKTLALSMVGSGMGLGAHLGRPRLEFKPTQIEAHLSALAVERGKAMVEYLQIQVGLPSYATFAPAVRAFDALASTAPAIREIITMGKVLWEVKTGHWDLVVADGPPTGQIGSFLGAADAMAGIVSTGRIADQSAWMREIQMDPSASELVMVTLPEELPTTETVETLTAFAAKPVMGATSIIANRVLDPLATDAIGTGAAAEAASLHRSLVSEQQIWLEALPSRLQVPFLFGMNDPFEIAESISTALAPVLV